MSKWHSEFAYTLDFTYADHQMLHLEHVMEFYGNHSCVDIRLGTACTLI